MRPCPARRGPPRPPPIARGAAPPRARRPRDPPPPARPRGAGPRRAGRGASRARAASAVGWGMRRGGSLDEPPVVLAHGLFVALGRRGLAHGLQDLLAELAGDAVRVRVGDRDVVPVETARAL